MKRIKRIDFFLQTILVITVLVGLCINNDETLPTFYFFVGLGVVQLISIILNLFFPADDWKKSLWRKIHHIGTLLILIAFFIIFNLERPANNDNEFYGLEAAIHTSIIALLFVLFYYIITWVEWRKLTVLSKTDQAV